MINALTIDVEDYFQVSAFERNVKREQWGDYPLRVENNTRRILGLLDEFGVTATFFVLGWVAQRCPSLVKDIHRAGHEVACHGFGHQRITTLNRQEFRDDIRISKALLEDLIGCPVAGYRAPSYSISLSCLWAFDEILDAGYLYDSSVFPVRHDLYGIPDWPRFPFDIHSGKDGDWSPENVAAHDRRLRVLPISTLRIKNMNLPIAGGGYFRLFPYAFTQWGLKRINGIENKPFVFYIHPWEIDPDQPRIKDAGFRSRFRHYLNLHSTEGRFRSLLENFRFSTARELLEISAG